MKLLRCLSVVTLVGAARIFDDLHYNKGVQTMENEKSASLSVVIGASESDPVGAPLYHVPEAVYNGPSPLAAPPRTPASTVLLPSLGQVNHGQLAATAYSAFDKCVWLFQKCSGIDISEMYDPKKKPNNHRRTRREAAATPAFLRYGYGPLPGAAHYPLHGMPTAYAYGAQVPAHGATQPGATTYGANMACGLFAWMCLPDMPTIIDPEGSATDLLDLLPIIG